MSRIKKYFYALFLSLLACNPLFAADQQWDIEIAYSGNLNGELEPCGCTAEGDLGGLKRWATVIERIKKANPDSFILSSGGLFAANDPSERIKNGFIQQGMATIGFDAIGVQWRDLIYGNRFIAESGLPWVWSNSKDNQFTSSKIIEKGSHRIAFFSWYDPDKEKQTAPLIEAIKQAKASGAVTVLAINKRLKSARKLLPFDHLDILLTKARGEPYGEPKMDGNTLILQPGTRGMYTAQLKLALDQNMRIADFEHKTASIPASVPDAPQMLSWYEAYNAEVKADFKRRVEIQKQRQTGTSPYTGAKACGECHQQEFETWSGSEHAKAYNDLMMVDKAFDPACVVCHTVGFNQDGGFIDQPLTPELANVQCENCHGAGREHALAAGQQPTVNREWQKEQMCGQCHIPHHSPSFNVEEYWKKIAHP